jgi:hypothetical protein
MNRNTRLLVLPLLLPAIAVCQNNARLVFDPANSTNGCYLVNPPRSGHPKGVLVLMLHQQKIKPAMVAGFELWSPWQDNSRTGLINFGLSDHPFK